MAFCADQVPQWNTISISGYHIREAGSTAAQELAFTLADGFATWSTPWPAGLDIEDFAPRLSFFFNSHLDFFEEIAKMRAARRIWARAMRDKYQAKNPRSWLCRFHVQTAGCSLTAQQPEINIVRTALEALAGVLGGCQSLHTNSMDEALALPSEKAVEIALRTQQIIAFESGAANVIDPLGGSYYVEKLTDDLEEEAETLLPEDRRARRRRQGHRAGLLPAGDHPGRLRIPDGAVPPRRSSTSASTNSPTRASRWRSRSSRSTNPWRGTRSPSCADQGRTRQRRRPGQPGSSRSGRRPRDRNLMPPLLECARRTRPWAKSATALTAVFGEYREQPFLLKFLRKRTTPWPTERSRSSSPSRASTAMTGAPRSSPGPWSKPGMEVVYLGLQQTPDSIVRAAVEEDADVIGLSILSGAHMTNFRKVRELMESSGLGDRLLTGGGIIPTKDQEKLKEMGVAKVFGPGDDLQEIVEYIRRNARRVPE